MLSIFGRRAIGLLAVTNMASACFEAKEEPALSFCQPLETSNAKDNTHGEVPAWNKNGVRCGLGSTICLASML